MYAAAPCGKNVSPLSGFVDTSHHAPAQHKQVLAAAGAVQALLQGGNECVAPGFNFVFHGKDVLPLAALLGFGLAIDPALINLNF